MITIITIVMLITLWHLNCEYKSQQNLDLEGLEYEWFLTPLITEPSITITQVCIPDLLSTYLQNIWILCTFYIYIFEQLNMPLFAFSLYRQLCFGPQIFTKNTSVMYGGPAVVISCCVLHFRATVVMAYQSLCEDTVLYIDCHLNNVLLHS